MLSCYFRSLIVIKEELIIYEFNLGQFFALEFLTLKFSPSEQNFRFSKFLLGTVKVTPELNEVGEIDNDESMSE